MWIFQSVTFDVLCILTAQGVAKLRMFKVEGLKEIAEETILQHRIVLPELIIEAAIGFKSTLCLY